jgi:hypothetical protein
VLFRTYVANSTEMTFWPAASRSDTPTACSDRKPVIEVRPVKVYSVISRNCQEYLHEWLVIKTLPSLLNIGIVFVCYPNAYSVEIVYTNHDYYDFLHNYLFFKVLIWNYKYI